MTWLDKVLEAKPEECDDEYIKGYRDGMEADVAEIRKQHSALAIALLDNKEKLCYAIKSGGYCPGDLLEGLPSVNLTDKCIPNDDKCLECWNKHMGVK